ncbi:MAG: YggS family pyridoxal phosphate-dependent enzyme [Flavobacteriales bacterium]|nr:YggS family pyridoxal phosphate-dependent enzyme [Flavobacteriales bacterium]MCX7768730.1 YggS family pyridoxal phosphate-dependent enzyme [Flavobacteriales bacterium]MDW8409890.1 YggS family pyridoxal phosphate-dependent enzyme [Flavobacteriales bacterium]
MFPGFQRISAALPRNVRLVAVTKGRPPEDILNLYKAGHRDFGENRVQELMAKIPVLPDDIRWHLIGHLQTNKVKYVAGKVFLIHSVDSEKLLDALEHQLRKSGSQQRILLQIHIAREESKYGFAAQELKELLDRRPPSQWPHLIFCGLMGMATNTPEKDLVLSEFRSLRSLWQELKEVYFYENPEFRELSMGMSSDWPLALEAGATMVRIGTALFEKD